MTLDSFPTTRPAFTANFARSQKMIPQSTFGRASQATSPAVPSPGTVVGSNKVSLSYYNTPRFNWKDGKCQGLLLEGSKTNYLPNSENWATWTSFINGPGETMPTADKPAPDGSNNAVEITFSSTYAESQIYYPSYGATPSSIITVSVWARSVTGTTTFRLQVRGGSPINNYSTKTFTATTKWQRFTDTLTAFAGQGDFRIVKDGTDVGPIQFWGAQLEQGYFPTSYIPTSGATATRAADTLTLDIADAWNADQQGTICTELYLIYRIQDNDSQSNNTNMWRLENSTGSPSVVGLIMRGQAGGGDGGDIRPKTYFPAVNGSRINNRQIFLPDTTGPNVLYKVAQSWFNGTTSATSLNEVGYQGVNYERIGNDNENINNASAERIGGFSQPMIVSRMCIYNSYSNKDQQVGLTQ